MRRGEVKRRRCAGDAAVMRECVSCREDGWGRYTKDEMRTITIHTPFSTDAADSGCPVSGTHVSSLLPRPRSTANHSCCRQTEHQSQLLSPNRTPITAAAAEPNTNHSFLHQVSRQLYTPCLAVLSRSPPIPVYNTTCNVHVHGAALARQRALQALR